ncbi:MAG: WYL domain-containing protein [Nostocaceae cyanobacterium CSU_2_110]|nr:WYL domain-containing protein [Nostocaceae cyanobacterium CSU_2_110]
MKSFFCLQKAKQDKQFPNRFQVVLPKWCLDEFDLLRWIIGFGASVKVVEPPELVEKINNIAKGIIDLYE